MKKAIRLQVTLWVRGEDEPAHDFAAAAIAAAHQIIGNGAGARPDLSFTVERIVEDDDYDRDDDAIA